MVLKDNLRKKRTVKGISQEKLAEEMSVSRQTVSKWENGESYPSTKHILMLADVLSCGVNELINEQQINNAEGEETKSKTCNKRFVIWLAGAFAVFAMMFGISGIIANTNSPIDSIKVAGFDKIIDGTVDVAMDEFAKDGYTEHRIVGYGVTEEETFYIKCELNGANGPCSALVYFCENGDVAYICQYLDDSEFIPNGKYYKLS